MLSIGLLIIVAAAYLLGRPDIGFWVVLLALANGLFALIAAVVSRQWYEQKALAAGVEPNYLLLFGTKIVVFLVLLWAAWFMASAAEFI